MELEFSKSIVPNMMIFKNESYKIIRVDEKFNIKKYKLIIDYDKVTKVIIDAEHPNCDPDTSEFCIPDVIKEIPVSENSIYFIQNLVERLFKTFNLDSCYFTPWGEFSYDKQTNE